jgi:hypothetical protein
MGCSGVQCGGGGRGRGAAVGRPGGGGECFPRVDWVAVPKALRARRVNRRARWWRWRPPRCWPSAGAHARCMACESSSHTPPVCLSCHAASRMMMGRLSRRTGAAGDHGIANM